jgi:hypothetical protein
VGAMAFDPTNLPDRASLNLFEATTYLAWGEALKDPRTLGQVDYPSARIYHPQIKQAAGRCCDKLRDGHRCSEYLNLIGNDESRGWFNRLSSAMLHPCEQPWPEFCQYLYALVLASSRTHSSTS